MRFLFILLCAAASGWLPSVTQAQSTIAPRSWDLTFGGGTIGTLMPEFELGENADGQAAFQDDLDSVGTAWQLKAVRRFLDTRTSFETRLFYGFSFSNQLQTAGDIDVFSPIDGSSNNFSGGQGSLEADLSLYGGDFAIKDTWRTRWGGLSAGLAVSYLGIDQDFEIDYSGDRLLSEQLNSDFFGGKALLGWEGMLLGRATNIDWGFGYYDLDAEYQFHGGAVTGDLTQTLNDHSATVEFEWTTWAQVKHHYVGFSLGGTYFTDMPRIVHNQGAQVSLDTDDAAIIYFRIETLL